MLKEIAHKRYILLIFIASIIIKAIFLFSQGAYKNPQPFEYEEVAENMLKGEGFYYTNFDTKYYAGIAPGFPVLCYLVYKLFGHHPLLVIMIQIIIASALVIPISLIARHIFDAKTAIAAGILTALYPPLIVYAATKLHEMSIYSFLFAISLWSFLLLKESVTMRRAAFVGLAAGISTLFRITSAVFLILGIIWFYFVSHEDAKQKLTAIFLIFAISLLILLPWGIRSYIIFGRPLLLQTNKGESLWYGNMPGSQGSLYTEGGVTIFDKARSELPPEFFKMNEIERGDYLKKLTLNYFKENPLRFIGRIFKKMYYFWYFSPYQGSLYPKLWMKLYRSYYLVILPLALFSIVYNFFFLRRDWHDAALIGLIFFALMCAHSLYFVEGRHRWSVEPLLLIFAANTIVIGARRIL